MSPIKIARALALIVSLVLGCALVEEAPVAPGATPGEVAPAPTEPPSPDETPAPGNTPAVETPGPEATPTAEEPTQTPEPAPADAPLPDAVRLARVADGWSAPVLMQTPPDGSGRLMVLDQVGNITIVDAQGERLDTPFLDLADRMVGLNPGYDERGLLGMAFHPQFAENGLFYAYYSAPLRAEAPGNWNHTSHLSEFTVSAEDPNRADPDSERIVLQVDQPQSNHNGGKIAFGPDGYLYIALGDGGGQHDLGTGHPPDGNGQDPTTLLGSILRIDVNVTDGDRPYAIPTGNPFTDDPEAWPEIYAYGLRNPYRFSFDAGGDRQLFASDVGQSYREEVNIIEAGGNYGWNIREGTSCFSPSTPASPPAECPAVGPRGEPLIDPIVDYGHPNQPDGYGISVIGGYVYRGEELPGLVGRYVFGDWSTSLEGSTATLLVASAPEEGGATWTLEQIAVQRAPEDEAREYILSFAEGPELELYVLTSQSRGPSGTTGRLYRIEPAE